MKQNSKAATECKHSGSPGSPGAPLPTCQTVSLLSLPSVVRGIKNVTEASELDSAQSSLVPFLYPSSLLAPYPPSTNNISLLLSAI